MTGNEARAQLPVDRDVVVKLHSTGRELPRATVIQHWPGERAVILGLHPDLLLVHYADIQAVR